MGCDAALWPPCPCSSPALRCLLPNARSLTRGSPPSHSARQHVPLPEYEANLRAMVDYMRRVGGVSRILLVTPPPVWGPGRKKHQIWVSGVPYSGTGGR